MNKDKFYEFLRWVAVIPGGLISGFILLFPLHLFLKFRFNENSTIYLHPDLINSIERFLSPILISFMFVYCGSLIAPYKLVLVSKILFSIYTISFICTYFLLNKYFDHMMFEKNFTNFLQFALQIFAAHSGTLIIRKRKNNYY